jgi:CheY-like chemotaxis protein
MTANKKNESDILIAVVNNHVQTAVGISNFLEEKGYRTIQAYAGSDAIKLCQKEKPDLLFIDVQMPQTTGFDVARALPNQKILFMVASFDGVGDKAKAFPNCVGVLFKPVDNAKLDDFLRKYFKLKKPELE